MLMKNIVLYRVIYKKSQLYKNNNKINVAVSNNIIVL